MTGEESRSCLSESAYQTHRPRLMQRPTVLPSKPLYALISLSEYQVQDPALPGP